MKQLLHTTKLFWLILLTLVGVAINKTKAQQVTVTSTAGSGASSPGGYSSLIGAFSDINSGVYQGDIDIRINSSFSMSASASLNQSGTGSASYTTVMIGPGSSVTSMVQVSTTTAGINFNVLCYQKYNACLI
jgi:hypothetical protein